MSNNEPSIKNRKCIASWELLIEKGKTISEKCISISDDSKVLIMKNKYDW